MQKTHVVGQKAQYTARGLSSCSLQLHSGEIHLKPHRLQVQHDLVHTASAGHPSCNGNARATTTLPHRVWVVKLVRGEVAMARFHQKLEQLQEILELDAANEPSLR
jgi:hypothetical protein